MSGIRKRSGKRKAVCPVYGFAGKGSAKLLFFLFFFCLATSAVAACAVRKTKKTPACSIEAVLEENALTIRMNYRYMHEGEKEISVLPFLLYTNAYREGAKKPVTTEDGERKVYPNGKSYMKTDILSVFSEGEDATFSVGGEDDNVLYVDLGRTLFTGEEVAVEVDYRLILPECRFRTGIWENKVNLGDWLPVCCRFSDNGFREISYSPFGDPYDLVCCDYSVELTVPSEYIVASGGKAVGTEVKGEVTVYSFDLQKGRDISFVLGKNFNVASGVANGVCVSYYTEREEFREDLELALDALDFFASSFGKYPYETYSVAETAFAYGGMEYSGLSVVSDSLEKEERRRAIVHETAHQWWRGGVGFDQTKEHYLDEGLAEYSAYLYWKEKGDAGVAEEILAEAISAYKSFFELSSLLNGTADTRMDRDLSEFSSLLEYGNIAYNKSLVMFCRYGETIGERKTKQKLAKFYKKNLYGIATLSDLTDVLGYAEHFRSFVEGKVLI